VSGLVLFLISLITANLFLESSRVTEIGCNALTKMPIIGIFSFAALDKINLFQIYHHISKNWFKKKNK
jgi:hypothetical protein